MKRMQPLVSAICVSLVLGVVATSANSEEKKKQTYQERVAGEAYDAEGNKKDDAAQQPPLYPQATRVPPKAGGNPSLVKLRNQMITAFQKDKADEARQHALELKANEKANDNDKATADQVLLVLITKKDNKNNAEAIPLLEEIISLDAMDNNTHYSMMSQLAQRYLVNQDYQDALDFSTRFLAETKSEKKEIIAVKGNSLYRLHRLPEAITELEKVRGMDMADTAVTAMLVKAYSENKQPAKAAELAKTIVQTTGNDRVSQINLAITFFEAKQLNEAGDVIDQLRTSKQLTDEHDYKTAVMVYSGMKGREADLAAVVQEGLDKGVLQASAYNYNILAEAYYYSDGNGHVANAIAAWAKGAPLAKDGGTYLNLAIAQCQDEVAMWAACKESAKSAIAKGGVDANAARQQIVKADSHLGKSK